MPARLLFVHAISPLHAGTGQSTGAIDLAIARDRSTGIPYLPASSLKGALRARSELQLGAASTKAVFGPDTAAAKDHAGSALFGDANLLLLPVRSLAGTYAWVTCPLVLARLRRDASEADMHGLPAIPAPASTEALLGAGQKVSIAVTAPLKVVLEELDLTGRIEPIATSWATWLATALFGADGAWQGFLKARFAIVPDDVFSFLAQHATDVVARIRLEDDTKTVADGQLWYEEHLPTESILVSLVAAEPTPAAGITPQVALQRLTTLIAAPIQLGGKASVGRGRCRLVLGGAA
ncbi:MAG: type III-B CRISPR module RAMP protein Cmr4 [Myxococcota bacterium]